MRRDGSRPNPYDVDDRDWQLKLLVAGVTAMALLLALLAWRDGGVKVAEAGEAYEEQYLPGQPLDAVRVTAPTFAGGACYKVVDRTSGATWWLVQMADGDQTLRWQVLTVGVGEARPGLLEVGHD